MAQEETKLIHQQQDIEYKTPHAMIKSKKIHQTQNNHPFLTQSNPVKKLITSTLSSKSTILPKVKLFLLLESTKNPPFT